MVLRSWPKLNSVSARCPGWRRRCSWHCQQEIHENWCLEGRLFAFSYCLAAGRLRFAAVRGENIMKYTHCITLRSLKAGMVRLIRLQGLSIGKASCLKSRYWRYICLRFDGFVSFCCSCCLITKAVQRCPDDCKALERQFQERFLVL